MKMKKKPHNKTVGQTSNFRRCLGKKQRIMNYCEEEEEEEARESPSELIEGRWMVIANWWTKHNRLQAFFCFYTKIFNTIRSQNRTKIFFCNVFSNFQNQYLSKLPENYNVIF